MNVTNSVGLEELCWSLLALLGIYAAGREYREARADREIQRRSGVNGSMSLWADYAVFSNGSTAFVQVMFLIVGLIAMIREPSGDSRVFSRLVVAGALIACEGLLVAVSLRGSAVRKLVRDEFQRLRSQDSYSGTKKRRTDKEEG